ncbi:hypothetical protein ACFEMC_01365 [Kineococcus sp. DHX-1]
MSPRTTSRRGADGRHHEPDRRLRILEVTLEVTSERLNRLVDRR